MRGLWMAQGERLGVQYELQQANTKMRLATQHEIDNHINSPQAIYESHVSHMTGHMRGVCIYVYMCVCCRFLSTLRL